MGKSLEQYYPGTVRLIPWDNGPGADLSLIPTDSRPLIEMLVAREHVTGPEVVVSHHYPVHVPSHRGDLTVALIFWEKSLLPLEL